MLLAVVAVAQYVVVTEGEFADVEAKVHHYDFASSESSSYEAAA